MYSCNHANNLQIKLNGDKAISPSYKRDSLKFKDESIDKGVWKTQKAGTTRISFIFAIGVTCKHYHATDWEDSTVDSTKLAQQ